MNTKKVLSPEQRADLILTVKTRFEKNKSRHSGLIWIKIQERLEQGGDKLWSLNEMEKTGGEPDIIGYDKKTDTFIFYDCSAESPIGRRSICYDQDALNSRKENKPVSSALEMAKEMGIEILTEAQYRELQQLGKFDAKTSSWIKTPVEIRKLGGAIFADYRYGNVFVYHNGAESYYTARGFRGCLRI